MAGDFERMLDMKSVQFRPPSLRVRKQKVLDILRRQQLAVISTVGAPNPQRCYPGAVQLVPESALVAFTEDDELRLYFQTGRHTRKAGNLAGNPFAAFVINDMPSGSLYPTVTVQYQGRAQQLTSAEDLEICKRRFATKGSPTTEKFFNDPSAIFFAVDPVWIGCSDYTTKAPEVIEIDF